MTTTQVDPQNLCGKKRNEFGVPLRIFFFGQLKRLIPQPNAATDCGITLLGQFSDFSTLPWGRDRVDLSELGVEGVVTFT